jgi:hypothetical protein
MRLHPIIWMLARVASQDDVIPLAFPITTTSGEQVSSIPVKKGTVIDIAFHAYQRYGLPFFLTFISSLLLLRCC